MLRRRLSRASSRNSAGRIASRAIRRMGRGQREVPARCARDRRFSSRRRLGLHRAAGLPRRSDEHSGAKAGLSARSSRAGSIAAARSPAKPPAAPSKSRCRRQRRHDLPRHRARRRSEPAPPRALSHRRARRGRRSRRRAQQDRPQRRSGSAGGRGSRAPAVRRRPGDQREAGRRPERTGLVPLARPDGGAHRIVGRREIHARQSAARPASCLKTAEISEVDGKGRHTTTARHLVELPGGALLIDTPGMRELQPWVDESAVAETFEDIAELARGCRFGDCAHETEPGCAVLAAVERGRAGCRAARPLPPPRPRNRLRRAQARQVGGGCRKAALEEDPPGQQGDVPRPRSPLSCRPLATPKGTNAAIAS